jgi:hypothetical protein
MRIHVVDRNGDYLSPLKAGVRYTVLAIPTFLNGLSVPASSVVGPLGWIVGLGIFGLGGASAYLIIFNRRTRQSVHDLAVGSFVTKSASEGEVVASVPRLHLAIAGALFALSAIGLVVIGSSFVKSLLPEGVLRSVRAIESTGKVFTSSVLIGKSFGPGGEATYVDAEVTLKAPIRIDQVDAAAAEIATIVMREFPGARNVDTINVTVKRGYDIGFSSGWKSMSFSHSPAEWKALEP